MKKKIEVKIVSVMLILSMLFSISGCSQKEQTEGLMESITANPVEGEVNLTGEGAAKATDFAVRLFQRNCSGDENTLVSPLSVLYALSMTANGAEGNTRMQMEQVLGMPVEEWNLYLHAFWEALPENEKYKLSIANSIWFKEDEKLTINQEFLQANADYYGAGIYKTAFDQSAVEAMNTWVSDNTDGMIENILNEIPEGAVMYLVNALVFDADWQTKYESYDIYSRRFTKEDGTRQIVDMMYTEEWQYLEDENTSGFLKYYEDRKYAFVALLPEEGVAMKDYVASLSGEKVSALLSGKQEVLVKTALPRFEVEYDVELSEVLSEMGMPDAFDFQLADFSGIGQYADANLSINRVLHKTCIKVGEEGTKAGAATVVEVMETAAEELEDVKEVYLNRPFVYMIIDCETNVPVFIGTVMDVEKTDAESDTGGKNYD